MEYDCSGHLDGLRGSGGCEMGYIVSRASLYDRGNDFCGSNVGGEFVLGFTWVDFDI